MNKFIKRTLVSIIGIAFLGLFTGCATNISRHYPHYEKMSQEEAIRLVKELKAGYGDIVNQDKVASLFVTQTGLGWVEVHQEYSLTSLGTTYNYQEKTEYFQKGLNSSTEYMQINFSDVTEIKLSRKSPYAYLLLWDPKWSTKRYVGISCVGRPEPYDEFLSAFLTLCPNVK
jgi:hypothetical protein